MTETISGRDGWTPTPIQTDADGRLIVRGEDQLHSFAGVLGTARTTVISGAGGYANSDLCPAGTIWVVTTIAVADITSPTTEHQYYYLPAAIPYHLSIVTAAFPLGRRSFHQGLVWFTEGAHIRVYFIGGLVGDSCTITLIGHSMTLET